jgi:uncharacterized tellurite resistance protein B-like protein
MASPISAFSLTEKLAIVHAVDAVIFADGVVHQSEVDTLSKLMNRIDFDSDFLLKARSLSENQMILILKDMTSPKKKALEVILNEMANADGFLHQKELEFILNTCTKTGIQNET